MGKIITLSGCRGIGKSTLIHGIHEVYPNMYIREGFRRLSNNYDLSVESDYYLNEKEYVEREISEFQYIKTLHENAILLRGPEDLEFFIKHYPISINKNWDVEKALRNELTNLRKCRSDYILYLTAAPTTVIQRSNFDTNKRREDLRDWLDNWQPYIDTFMKQQLNTVILNTDNMSSKEVLDWTLRWMRTL